MNILIVDDEPPARRRLRSLLEDLDVSGMRIEEAENGARAIALCTEICFDLVFLDIRMPVVDGFDAAREISVLEPAPLIIFVTAYDEHALQAFEANAVDYLLKPVRVQRLQQSMKKAAAYVRPHQATLQPGIAALQPVRKNICIHERGGIRLIAVAEIRCFVADQKYVAVKTGDREELIDEPLKSLEHEFAGTFVRVHRNALVAVGYIERLHRGPDRQTRVYLRGLEQSIEVSRRHVAEIRALVDSSKAPPGQI